MREGAELHAPALARYEIANAPMRKTSMGEVEQDDLAEVWAELEAMPIAYHPLGDGARVIGAAEPEPEPNAYSTGTSPYA